MYERKVGAAASLRSYQAWKERQTLKDIVRKRQKEETQEITTMQERKMCNEMKKNWENV